MGIHTKIPGLICCIRNRIATTIGAIVNLPKTSCNRSTDIVVNVIVAVVVVITVALVTSPKI